MVLVCSVADLSRYHNKVRLIYMYQYKLAVDLYLELYHKTISAILSPIKLQNNILRVITKTHVHIHVSLPFCITCKVCMHTKKLCLNVFYLLCMYTNLVNMQSGRAGDVFKTTLSYLVIDLFVYSCDVSMVTTAVAN